MSSTTWGSAELDLDSYLRRIGFQGEPSATLATLRELQSGHVSHFPFENLEIQLGREIKLDLPSLQRKMVLDRRGGYCYEHTVLFAAVLERLGFGVEGLSARVRLGQEDRRLPATHATLRVTTPDTGQQWLCDVGFGQCSFRPAEFVDGAEVTTGGWRYRLVREDEWVWVWQQFRGEQAVDAHAFTLTPQYPIDYEVGSFYVSKEPRSPFVTGLFVGRVTEGAIHNLDKLELSTSRPDGSKDSVRELEPEEVPKVLEGIFGIELDDADQSALVRRLRDLSQAEANATA